MYRQVKQTAAIPATLDETLATRPVKMRDKFKAYPGMQLGYAIAIGVGGIGFVIGLAYGIVEGSYIAIGISTGCFLFVAIGLYRMILNDWRERSFIQVAMPEPEPPEPESVDTSKMIFSSADGAHQKIGTIVLTNDKWTALGEVIKSLDGRLTRNSVPKKTFVSINDNWPKIQSEFVNLGTFEKRGRVLYILDDGRAFFEQFGVSIPPPTP